MTSQIESKLADHCSKILFFFNQFLYCFPGLGKMLPDVLLTQFMSGFCIIWEVFLCFLGCSGSAFSSNRKNTGLTKTAEHTHPHRQCCKKGGRAVHGAETRFPRTMRLLQASQIEFINARFSALRPQTHITPHCGVSNAKLRAHVAVRVPRSPATNQTNETPLSYSPPSVSEQQPGQQPGQQPRQQPRQLPTQGRVPLRSGIRVGDQQVRQWKEGEILLFDDSFEHEVVHPGDQPRVVLIADFANPFLASAELYQAALLDHAAGSAAAAEEYRAFRAREERELRPLDLDDVDVVDVGADVEATRVFHIVGNRDRAPEAFVR